MTHLQALLRQLGTIAVNAINERQQQILLD